MENKRICTVLGTLMLLSSVLLSINVIAQNISAEYISFSSNRNGNYDIYVNYPSLKTWACAKPILKVHSTS